MTNEEFRMVKADFVRECLANIPDAMCGASTVGTFDRSVTKEERATLCIFVGLRSELPEGATLPATYKGVRVFSEFRGKIRALEQ